MIRATLRLLALFVGVLLIGSGGSVQGQGAFSHGAVVALQGTPHLWFADEHGVLHWGGDTRALAGRHIAWSNRVEVSLEQLRTLPVGDPWLTAGLLKDGDPDLSGQVGDGVAAAATAPYPVHQGCGAIWDQWQQLRELRDREG